MSGKDLKDAAEKTARRKELLRRPVTMLPDAPENIRLSKAEFIAKRRHSKEEEIAVEQFKKEFRAKKAGGEENANDKKEEGKEKEVVLEGKAVEVPVKKSYYRKKAKENKE